MDRLPPKPPSGPPRVPPARLQAADAKWARPTQRAVAGERPTCDGPDRRRDVTVASSQEITLVVPEQPPRLTPGAARALLQLLRRAADREGSVS
jgi:hypothetical protein